MTSPIGSSQSNFSPNPIGELKSSFAKVADEYSKKIYSIKEEFLSGDRSSAIEHLNQLTFDVKNGITFPSKDEVLSHLNDANRHAEEGNVSWGLSNLNEAIQCLNQ